MSDDTQKPSPANPPKRTPMPPDEVRRRIDAFREALKEALRRDPEGTVAYFTGETHVAPEGLDFVAHVVLRDEP